MSKTGRNKHSLLSAQGRLFDNELSDSALDVRLSFRDSLSRALRRSKHSRWHFAAEVSRLSGHELSKEMLDKCTSSNFDYGLRAEDLPAVLFVAQELEPLRALLSPLGCEALSPEDSRFFRLLRLIKEKSRIDEEIKKLSKELGTDINV